MCIFCHCQKLKEVESLVLPSSLPCANFFILYFQRSSKEIELVGDSPTEERSNKSWSKSEPEQSRSPGAGGGEQNQGSAMAGLELYCLRWKYHHSNLQTMFSQLLERESFCDVTLACEGKTLRAHKVNFLLFCTFNLPLHLILSDAGGLRRKVVPKPPYQAGSFFIILSWYLTIFIILII